MSSTNPSAFPPGMDPLANPEMAAQLQAATQDLFEQGQRLMSEFADRQGRESPYDTAFMQDLMQAYGRAADALMRSPGTLADAQAELWQSYTHLWQESLLAFWTGGGIGKHAEPARDDRRFRHQDWQSNTWFDFLKQSYLLGARWLLDTLGQAEGLDEETRRTVDFYTRQYVDALSPSNFAVSNPEVLHAIVDTGGRNLIDGMRNLLTDLQRSDGRLNISMVNEHAFELGTNIATTPGKVVFENALMQLIQYTPATEQVAQRPLLIVPPWINKYYILDLRPDNSFIRWCVEQGQTVFTISWVNPDEQLAEKSLADYMHDGPLAALEAIREATGEDTVNAIGYCLGGTLLSCTLAWLAAQDRHPIASATLFASMLDFEHPGELGVYVNEGQLQLVERKMAERGYLDGGEMAQAFNMLRANDLIWSFYVNNYLLGKEPPPFDLLYWNSDSTRMPRAMHSEYLRSLYQRNALREPGGMTLADVPLDLRQVKAPVYMVSSEQDHIAPWKSTYAGTRLFGGPVRFVLAGSGHIAGIINPPAANKYHHYTNNLLPAGADSWLKGAKVREGSWWPDWQRWLARRSPKAQRAARVPGEGALPAIEDAPGRYVRVRSRPPAA